MTKTNMGHGSFKASPRRLALALLLVIACGSLFSAFAQTTTEGAIGGTISDPQNSVVPKATVTIRNLGNNDEKTATSSDTGYYRFPQLSPGTYDLKVAAQGFAVFEAEQVIVSVGSLTTVNPQLSIGANTSRRCIDASQTVHKLHGVI